MNKCPRCKVERPRHFFQEPVAICIVCYSAIPTNRSLSIPELRDKMAHSRRARAQRAIARRLEVESELGSEDLAPALPKEQRTVDEILGIFEKGKL